HRRHVLAQIVTAPFLKLLWEGRRPVLHSHFVAVDEGANEPLRGQRTERVEEIAAVFVDVELHRFGAELVYFKPEARIRWSILHAASRRMPNPKDRPAAWRSLPGEFAVGIHLCGKVEQPFRINRRDGFRRRILLLIAPAREVGLESPVRQTARAGKLELSDAPRL